MALDGIRAILLDRDGTINVERADYVRTDEQFELLPGAADAFAVLGELGLPVAVVTNQAGIARGLVTERDLAAIHRHLLSVAKERGLELTAVLVCPHHPEAGCACRKPRPGLLLDAAALLGLRPEDCLLIGDSMNDYLAAQAAGCQVILVKSGRQSDQLLKMPGESQIPFNPPLIVQDLLKAAHLVSAELAASRRQLPLGMSHVNALSARA